MSPSTFTTFIREVSPRMISIFDLEIFKVFAKNFINSSLALLSSGTAARLILMYS